MTAKETPKSLSEIFSETDQISFGIFSITKSARDSWNAARFHLADREVRISAQQKQLMALLIAHNGAFVPPALIASEVSGPQGMPMSSVKEKIKRHVACIRKAIRDSEAIHAYPDAPERIVALRSPTQTFGSHLGGQYRLKNAPPKHNI